MTSERRSILLSLIAATLVACGGCARPASPSAAPSASVVVEGDAATPVLSTEQPVVSQRKVFRPSDAGFDLSFGRFGYPCDLEHDSTTHVVMLHCDKVDTPNEAGITVNFYLPGIWSSEPFTAESVASSIRDNVGPSESVNGAFGVPDSATGKLAYFLTTSAVYSDTNRGQAFIMKIAPLDDAVYSVFYTTIFLGWLAAHITEYGREIGNMSPDPSWVAYLRSKLREPSPPNQGR
jgi:hypothetical protein